jgi:hypothetical protein
MLFMIIEKFKNGDPVPIYRRFRDHGRLAPDGLRYISSWVDENFERCFQVMETSDRKSIDRWMENWSDIVDFRSLSSDLLERGRRENCTSPMSLLTMFHFKYPKSLSRSGS